MYILPHRGTHWERNAQQRPPQTWGDIHTKKQNCCSSAFVVMSQGSNKLYSSSRLISGLPWVLKGCCWPTMSMACALSNLFSIHSDWLVWLCPSDQGHAFSRQLVRVWDAFCSCDGAKVQALLGKNSCPVYLPWSLNQVSWIAMEHFPMKSCLSVHTLSSPTVDKDRCILQMQITEDHRMSPKPIFETTVSYPPKKKMSAQINLTSWNLCETCSV